MRINSKVLGASAGIVAGATFVICGLFVAAAPGTTSAFLGWVLHMNFSAMARPMSVASFFGGLVLFAAFIGICVGLVSGLYNRITNRAIA